MAASSGFPFLISMDHHRGYYGLQHDRSWRKELRAMVGYLGEIRIWREISCQTHNKGASDFEVEIRVRRAVLRVLRGCVQRV